MKKEISCPWCDEKTPGKEEKLKNDYGTMIESLVPWHPTAVFMVATLGVPVSEYWNWQFLTLVNFITAPLLAITGIGCFYKEKKKSAKVDKY